MQGLFITVEGIDGSGKTTVASAFAERLRQEGFAVVVTAEPGGTPLGERLRQLLLREKPLSAWAEAFLFLAARAEHVAQVIRPALRQGETECLRVLPHSSTPAILSKTRLRMRLWTKRIRLTRAARPQKDRASIR
jgi:predicted ATPase